MGDLHKVCQPHAEPGDSGKSLFSDRPLTGMVRIAQLQMKHLTTAYNHAGKLL